MSLTAEQTIRLEIVSLLLAAGEQPASAAAAAPSLIRLVVDGPDDPLSDLRAALEGALAEARDAKQRYESAIAALPAVKVRLAMDDAIRATTPLSKKD